MRPPKLALAATIVALAITFGSTSGTAAAADFCVGSHPFCVGASFPANTQGIRDALTATNGSAGADRVYISAGDYPVSSNINFTPNAKLEVIGEGIGATRLTATADAVWVLNLNTNPAPTSRVSDLTIRHQGFSSGKGANFPVGTIERVRFEVTSPGSVVGLSTYGATVDDSQFSGAGSGALLVYSEEATTITDSYFDGDGNAAGVAISGSGTRTLDRVRFRSLRVALVADSGSVAIRNSFVDLAAQTSARGVIVENDNNSNSSLALDADNVTVVGSGESQVGIAASATASGDSTTENSVATIDNSIVHLAGIGGDSIRCRKTGAATTASMAISYSAYNPAKLTRDAGCTGVQTNSVDLTAQPPVFNHAAVGDFRPTAASSVVDSGDPGAPGIGTDLDGLARVFDGDTDTIDRIDIGASEFQPAMAPSRAAISATPEGSAPGQSVSFSAVAIDPDGGTVTYEWDFGDGGSATGATPSHSFASSGDYLVSVEATDQEGESTTSTKSVHVVSNPPTTPTAGADRTTAVRGEGITFTASGSTDPDGGPVSYEWTFTGGGSASGSPVVRAGSQLDVGSWQKTFTATVEAVDQSGEHSDPASVAVTITNRHPEALTLETPTQTAPRGGDFTFNATASDPDGDSKYFDWDYGDGVQETTSVNPQATHAYSTLGVKTVTLTVRDAYQGADTIVDTVEVVNRAPFFGSGIVSDGPRKVGQTQPFSAPADDADGDPIEYSWDFGDGSTATGVSPSHVFGAAGSYNVTVSANDGQGAVTVAQLPVTISERDAVLVLGKAPRKGFKRTGKPFSVSTKKSARGIPVTLNVATSATIRLARPGAGFRKGTRCVSRRPSGAKATRCDLPLGGSQTLLLPAGRSKLLFGGKWRGKKLPAGRYAVTVRPAGLKDGKRGILSLIR